MEQLPRLGKRELICLLLFACNCLVSVSGGFLFLWVLGMGYVILLWHSLSLPYNYFAETEIHAMAEKGLIEPSHSAWSAPAVLVPKRDRTTWFA